MLDVSTIETLERLMRETMKKDSVLLNKLRDEIRPLKNTTKKIFPRTTTSISLVGTDGGNNRLVFDPFIVQIIRVVDSSDNQYYMDVITPTTPIKDLNNKILSRDGNQYDSLADMMEYLGVKNLAELSPMIHDNPPGEPVNASWVQVYRELVEWATLFSILRSKDFGTDTLIVFDGLLRSKVFSGDLFLKLRAGIDDAIEAQRKKSRRNIYIAGIAKHSKVLERYQLAMFIEGVMSNKYPCYVEIPRENESKAYVWAEYAKDDTFPTGGEKNKFVGGKMFFAKFGSGRYDPIWPIDILLSQTKNAGNIIGYLLADALDGFPVPFYPLCLQKAHQNAALVDFDMDIIQDRVVSAIRAALGPQAPQLDSFLLIDKDPAQSRY